jgi:hypothetical protein
MFPVIPEDAIAFIRVVFARENHQATNLLACHPSMHEEGLDFQLIAALNAPGPCRLPGSGVAIEIETHWLGGRRHYRSWEIADIGLAVMLRRAGVLVVRKVALLQSKRLYSREIPVTELEHTDYMIGIGRLVDRVEPIRTLTVARTFGFTMDCVYGAMTAGSEQVKQISEYQIAHRIPVYYNLYHPPKLPFHGTVPRLASETVDHLPALGCRVLSAVEAHAVLDTLPIGKTPSFSELISGQPKGSSDDTYGMHGWRLEAFVADELLRCREGRLFEDEQDARLASLLYERTAPIAAAIVITIDLPSRDE